jgi:hypothetical protein
MMQKALRDKQIPGFELGFLVGYKDGPGLKCANTQGVPGPNHLRSGYAG